MKFCLRLAETDFLVESNYDYVFKLCQGYTVSEAKSPISIKITEDDIRYEDEKSKKEDIIEGIEPRRFSNEYLESLSVYRKICDVLCDYDTILFHGSCIALDRKAYLFAAKSGTGKSTHTALWRELLGDRAVMVNDDKPLLKITDSSVIAYGTPWSGKHNLNENISVPLSAICFLHRGTQNRIERLEADSFSEVFPLLIQQTYRPRDAVSLTKVLGLIGSIKDKVRLYKLFCNTDISSAMLSYNAMKE